MSECHIDYQGIIRQIEDHVALKMLVSLTPDKSAANQLVEVMSVFVQNGVSVEKAMKILTELMPIFNKNKEKETEKQ